VAHLLHHGELSIRQGAGSQHVGDELVRVDLSRCYLEAGCRCSNQGIQTGPEISAAALHNLCFQKKQWPNAVRNSWLHSLRANDLCTYRNVSRCDGISCLWVLQDSCRQGRFCFWANIPQTQSKQVKRHHTFRDPCTLKVSTNARADCCNARNV
jgi:hypothetical protein